MARKKKRSRIVIPIIVVFAIVTAGTIYFFPRFLVYAELVKARRESGNPRRLDMQGVYDGEIERIQTDWMSLSVPLLYPEEDEWIEKENETDIAENITVSNNGIDIGFSRYKKEPQNDIIPEDERENNFGAETENESIVMRYKNTVGLPALFQSIEDIEAQGEKYTDYNAFHENQQYGYAEYNDIAYTISYTKEDEQEEYYISLYDIESEYELLGHINISYSLSANTKLVVEPSGILSMIRSIEFE
jgi:hypothetical protein